MKTEDKSNFYVVRPYNISGGSPYYLDIWRDGAVEPLSTISVNINHVVSVGKWTYTIYNHEDKVIKRRFWFNKKITKTTYEDFEAYWVKLSNNTTIYLKCGEPSAEKFISETRNYLEDECLR